MQMTVQAHAKINWSLNILSVREDGYHELDMLMQPLALHDTLTLEDADALSLSVDGAPLPSDAQNLVLKAANALNARVGGRNGARIRLEKRIPSRAGLGGGSADCAAALLALNRLWRLRLPTDALLEIGASLGADVPFCMTGGLARVRGIGEKIDPLPDAPSVPVAMVTPGGGLSTPAVFREFDSRRCAIRPMDTPTLAKALTRRDFAAAQALSYNALEAPAIALMPEIGAHIRRFHDLGARYVRMTGSGSTVFAVFDTDEQARFAAAQIPEAVATRTLGKP